MNDALYLQAQKQGAAILEALDQAASPGPTTILSPIRTLMESIIAFNLQDWNWYERLLDPNVVVHNIAGTVDLEGRDAVMKHFRSQEHRTYFELTQRFTWSPPKRPNMIEGIGMWTHAEHGHIRVPIHYRFTFSPDGRMLVNVWAEHSDLPDRV